MRLQSILLVILVSRLLSYSDCRAQEKEETGFNIILISIDTLRADHLHCYGYSIPNSPHIDALAQEGALFLNAISQAVSTLPSHASIFTSRYPSQHRAVDRDDYAIKLDDSEETIAEILGKNGYRTAAFTGGGEMSAVFNIGQGFGIYDEKGGKLKEIDQRAFRWLEENRDSKFFLFLHCYDVHLSEDNRPSQAFFSQFPFEKQQPDIDNIYQLARSTGDLDQVRRELKYWYDGSIASVDAEIGVLLEKIKALGLEDKTVVVFTSDHGEEFFEHRHIGHSFRVYDEVIRVPLIIRNKKLFPGKKISGQVRSIDIAPTILEIAGLPAPAAMMGKSVLGLIRGEAEAPRLAFCQNDMYTVICCRTMDHKLIRSQGKPGEWYDLSADPGEKTNLFSTSRPEHLLTKLDGEMDEWSRLTASTASAGKTSNYIEKLNSDALPERLRDQLRSLGYAQ